MLKTWNQINKEWFAEGSRPPKKSWIEMVKCGAVSGKVICGTPYIEEDHLAIEVEISTRQGIDASFLLD